MPKRMRNDLLEENKSKLIKLDNYQIGINYLEGINGCEINYPKAFKFFIKDGSADAYYHIAKMCEDDYKTLKHNEDNFDNLNLFDGHVDMEHYYNKAKEYYEKCAKLNHVKGMWGLHQLTNCNSTDPRSKETYDYLMKLGNLGLAEAYKVIAYDFYVWTLRNKSTNKISGDWMFEIDDNSLFDEILKNLKIGADLGNKLCMCRYGFLSAIDYVLDYTLLDGTKLYKLTPIEYIKHCMPLNYEVKYHFKVVFKDNIYVIDEALKYLLDGESANIKYILNNKEFANRYLTNPIWCDKLVKNNSNFVNDIYFKRDFYYTQAFKWLNKDTLDAIANLATYNGKMLDDKAIELIRIINEGINNKFYKAPIKNPSNFVAPGIFGNYDLKKSVGTLWTDKAINENDIEGITYNL